MEQKKISCGSVYDRVPPLSSNYPWFVAQSLEAEDETGDQVFFTIHDPPSSYRCRIPELRGRRIRASFHGWVILSNHPHNVEWFLWNPITSKLIRLGDHDDIGYCFLSSPPEEPGSVLLLLRKEKPNFVFCRLDRKRKKLRWTEMSYAKQLRRVSGRDGFLRDPTSCNGKVYAFNDADDSVVQIDIVVNDKDVVITLFPFVKSPKHFFKISCRCYTCILKGSCTDLFIVLTGYRSSYGRAVDLVHLFKLDMASMVWKEIQDLEDAIFFVDLSGDEPMFYKRAESSELGASVYFRGETHDRIIYSYNARDQTMFVSSVPGFMPTSRVSLSMWELHECRLKGDNHASDSKQEEKDNEIVVGRSFMNDKVELNSTKNESYLLNIPFHVLESIIERCVGIEYMKFRATSKLCRLAAPPIQWSNETALRRLQTYSLVSPWLMVVDTRRGVITFTDPIFGDKYFMKTFPVSIYYNKIHCSRYGWLLFFTTVNDPVFYNPFTGELRKLPRTLSFNSSSFSAPPTSPDCIVIGFLHSNVSILFVARDAFWRTFTLSFGDGGSYPFLFPTFYGRDLYALSKEVELNVFGELRDENFSWELFEDESLSSRCTYLSQKYMLKSDLNLLLVVVDELGESVKVFKLNDTTNEFENIDSLGRYAIFISETSCLCMEAKTPEMENKIYFPRLHSGNGKTVLYSLETCRYHTLNGKDFGDFIGTKLVPFTHAWIEPSWS